MLLFIIRHGDPLYNPECLTERGKLQAQALAKRLALYGIDEIYSSPLIRARQTAEPTEILLNKQAGVLEWTSEVHAWQDFAIRNEDGSWGGWVFNTRRAHLREALTDGDNWFDHPVIADTQTRRGYQRILEASDAFLLEHGYRHDRENKRYIAEEHNDKRIAVFCHEGFGKSWLGVLSDIPLPLAWSTFSITHTGMTVIEFSPDKDGLVVPDFLMTSSDSHLYREGLPTNYMNRVRF